MPPKKKSAKKTSPKKKAAPKTGASPASLTSIRARLPILRATRRAAYRSLYTNAQCEAWGAKTKSSDVHADGSRFALQIVQALAKRPEAVDGYSLERAAYLVECLDTLAAAIAEQKGGHHVAANAQALRDAAEVDAARAARRLRRKLRALAGGDTNKRKAIADAGAAKDHDAVATLEGLAELAQSWLADKSGHVVELARDARFTDADVATATNAAQALRAAREGKVLGGQDAERDTPPVNRAEGRVLREMRWAMDCFDEAHEEDSTIPKLVPSRATRAVLARHAGDAEDATDTTQPNPSPASPQAGGSARVVPKP